MAASVVRSWVLPANISWVIGKPSRLTTRPDHDLLAVGPMIARIAALGLAVAGALALEIGRGEIVEIDRGVEIEQAALARNQRRLDGGAVRMQLVEHLVERVFRERVEVGAEDIGKRGAPDPIRHGVFGARRNQAIEHHRAGEPLHGLPTARSRAECGRVRDAARTEGRHAPARLRDGARSPRAPDRP